MNMVTDICHHLMYEQPLAICISAAYKSENYITWKEPERTYYHLAYDWLPAPYPQE